MRRGGKSYFRHAADDSGHGLHEAALAGISPWGRHREGRDAVWHARDILRMMQGDRRAGVSVRATSPGPATPLAR